MKSIMKKGCIKRLDVIGRSESGNKHKAYSSIENEYFHYHCSSLNIDQEGTFAVFSLAGADPSPYSVHDMTHHFYPRSCLYD
ncbi:hypothetical protein UFOVP1361_12 [uncultured Caudovirales phage]|uniref:Uncharacterized protein n=1 Tax=uncultured Caudovirales phage TaxID=2100421 RepID=A0A6J5S193_9CAUD|nr:hypothetical protein UFOVP1361_12 [uncultured Caudovirales phage]